MSKKQQWYNIFVKRDENTEKIERKCLCSDDAGTPGKHGPGPSYSKAWRLLKSAEADLGIPLLDTQKGGTKRAGSTLTPQGEELLDRYLAFEKEAREAVFAAFEKHFKADDAFQK